MKTLKKYYSLLLVAAISFGMISCDNNDDNGTPTPPEEITTEVVWGEYTGNVLVSPLEKEEGNEDNKGTAVSAKIENDTIAFEDFPIKDIVLSIVNDEEAADKIVEAVGKISYKIGYKPAITEQKDTVNLTLDPKPLELTINIPAGNEGETSTLLVKANVEAGGEDDNYSVETNNIKFNFVVKEVLIGIKDTEMTPVGNFTPSLFDFDMDKKTK